MVQNCSASSNTTTKCIHLCAQKFAGNSKMIFLLLNFGLIAGSGIILLMTFVDSQKVSPEEEYS
jgi:hypothetical protein